MTFKDRLSHLWNVFQDAFSSSKKYSSIGSSIRSDRSRLLLTSEQSVITSIYNRIAVDVAAIPVQHVMLDENRRYLKTINSDLNLILTIEANKDQTGRALIQDIVMSMFDEGCVAVVPIETNLNPTISNSYEIKSMRTGKILEWYPDHILVCLYNERTGLKENVLLPKSFVAIIENPFYSIMNESNSILKRLIRKLNLLDIIDEQSGSGKLDLIIQLPYVIKTEGRRKEAESRRLEIEKQLAGSKYGIAYTDGTEKVTQLNRPAENNLMTQIQYLTSMLYSQLGLTEDVFNGKANEAMMLNYFNRTITPILVIIVDEFNRKFLTKTARTQGHQIMYFKDIFKFTPVTEIANISDKLTRNEILSSNEIRSIIGFKPSSDPRAEELKNKNLRETNTLEVKK